MKKIKEWFLKLLSKVFIRKKIDNEFHDEENIEDFFDEITAETEMSEEFEHIKENKSIIKKLNFLENRVRIFATMFPNEYARYKSRIDGYKEEYQRELDEYIDAYENRKVTFCIDPENESKKINAVYMLENEIDTFIVRDVKFKTWVVKLSELCYKLNILYNVSLNSSDKKSIFNQATRAINNLENNISELKNEVFFNSDVRKKTEILEYVFYSSYIVFKLFLRCGEVANFIDFKEKIRLDDFFEISEYNTNVLKFVIDDIKNIEKYITAELQNDKMYAALLEKYERLQRQYVESEKEIATDNVYFEKILKSENTIYGIANIHGKEFNVPFSTLIDMSEYNKEGSILTAKEYSLFVLRCISNNISASMLVQFIERVSDNMTYKEFFFICKIFNLHDIVKEIAVSNGITSITSQFAKLEEKYRSVYSDKEIILKKQKVLRHKNDTVNKYGKFVEIENGMIEQFCNELEGLSLDYYRNGKIIYLNSIYFNGFANIQNAFM